jgi:hypothetical protein
MSTRAVSPAVLRFLNQYIESVPQLEILVLLQDQPEHWWQLADVARRLYLSTDAVGPALDELVRRGLCVRREDPLGFKCGSKEGLGMQLREVLEAYQTNLVGVTRVIHANAISGARDFARAFDLRKDE